MQTETVIGVEMLWVVGEATEIDFCAIESEAPITQTHKQISIQTATTTTTTTTTTIIIIIMIAVVKVIKGMGVNQFVIFNAIEENK